MSPLLTKAYRVLIVFELTFKEAFRRRLLVVLVLGCILFMGSGAGCLRACRGMVQSSVQGQEQQMREDMASKGMKQDEIEEVVKSQKSKLDVMEKATQKQLKTAVLGFSYGLIAFWLFMIAGVFTPFLAMNDFQSRTHVMLLARPVTRAEYLSGKYGAILGLLIVNLVLLLGSFHLFTYFSLGDPGWEILRGIPIFVEGLALFTAILMFLSLTVGRIPAIFIGLVLVVVGLVPGIYLMGSPEKIGTGVQQVLIYAAAYGLPQFSINFLYGLGEVLDMPGVDNFLKSAGNQTGFYSLFINAAWLIGVWAGMTMWFRRKDVET